MPADDRLWPENCNRAEDGREPTIEPNKQKAIGIAELWSLRYLSAKHTTGPILSKQVKAYAITTKSRLPSLPELPTADEAGLKGFELAVWHGVFAPRGTPPAIVEKLSVALIDALNDSDLVKRFREISTEPMPADRATPEAAQRTLTSEIDRWAPIIKAAGEYAD